MSQFYVSVKLSGSVLRERETVSRFYVTVKLCVSVLCKCEMVCVIFM